MPRTNLPITSFVTDGLTTPGTSAVDPANGHEIAYAKTDDLIVEVNNTHATLAKTVTFKRGAVDLAPGAREDLVLSVPAVSRRFIRLLDSARFAQAGGKIFVDLEAGITGTIAAYVA
jgi:hypothetical protein